MTHPVALGDRFGSLVVERIQSQGANKPRAAFCRCDCGVEHKTDIGRLIRGVTTRCATCANPKWYAGDESRVRAQFVNYRTGAARRGYLFALTLDEFRALYRSACVYCGSDPAHGVDRRNNARGYSVENCSPCCKICNMAKRDMGEAEFLAWVARIAAHQGLSL